MPAKIFVLIYYICIYNLTNGHTADIVPRTYTIINIRFILAKTNIYHTDIPDIITIT